MNHSFPQHIEGGDIIATGGMGVVLKGKWNSQNVAIKIPSADYEIRQILRDGQVLCGLNHDNLVRILEINKTSDDELFVVMEYLSGGTLRTCIEEFREPDQAIGLVKQIATGLAYLHENGFVHRDIKPENILFDDQGVPKIADFGLAKVESEDREFSTAATVVGSRGYASPEMQGQIPGARLDYTSDVYSLGVILFELLTGTLPPVNDDWRPSRMNRMIDGKIDQICLGCLQHDPNRRYTIAKLLNAIEMLSQGRFPAPVFGKYEYPKVHLGNIVLNVTKILGGDGHTRYKYPDGIEVRTTDERFIVPDEIHEVTEDWLTQRVESNRDEGTPFENRDQPRIKSVGSGFTDEATEDLHPLKITLGRTKYFETQITNTCINFFLPDRQTIREKYAGSPDDFSESALANPLAINLSVITSDNHIFVAQRGKRVGVNKVLDPKDKNRVPAVSGTGHPDIDAGEDGVFCPFVAAKREAEEEVFGSGDLKLEDIVFFGIARTTGFFFPFLFGEIRTELSSPQFKSEPSKHINDVIACWGRPFTIESVTDWIIELSQLSGLSHTAIFSLYQSLIYEYPDRIGEINSRLSIS